MSDIAIKVENLSKQYRIGMQEKNHDTLIGKFTSMFKSPLSNFRRLSSLTSFKKGEESEDIIWALKDVSFEVKRGEVLGIIGGNGAGKTTLLKILSRITAPTSGRAIVHGRVGSLLEVGTGFHPDLTGRENIFVNGAILGMTKKEIERKFDEIVAFSEVEKFIDTPVKRYSSGMRIRLAFSVAAHLEPEILMIDEVLAVGDVAFQRKCLGKMKDVANLGRTVLFVSHNLGAVGSLCTRCMIIEKGDIYYSGETEKTISRFLALQQIGIERNSPLIDRKSRIGNGNLLFTDLNIITGESEVSDTIRAGEDIIIEIEYKLNVSSLKNVSFILQFKNYMGEILFGTFSQTLDQNIPEINSNSKVQCLIPKFPLKPGAYYITVQCKDIERLDRIENGKEFTVIDGPYFHTGKSIPSDLGALNVSHEWKYISSSFE